MSKHLVRLYPQDIDLLPWEPAPEGGEQRLLAKDDAGSITRYWRLPAGQRGAGDSEGRWRELFVLEGALELDGETYREGSYICLPPDVSRGSFTGADAVCLETLDHHDRLGKPETRLTEAAIDRMPWEQPPSGQTGFKEKVLARDEHGSLSRVLQVELGGDTTEVDDHDHDEEVLIVAGACRNGEELHPAGTYTFNPPHAIHGPFLIYEPLVCLEIKNAPRSADLP